LLAIGAGEKPFIQQCTVSVWKNEKIINQFAYRQSGHKEVVRRTRERRWYSEELFARFEVIGSEGKFNGKPLVLETGSVPHL
jgi:heme-degrading monooxygenase HmoA